MEETHLRNILRQFRTGALSEDQILDTLTMLPYETLPDANIDHHRVLRVGFPEVIYAEGKTTAQIIDIAERILQMGSTLFVTRAATETARALLALHPDLHYDQVARTVATSVPDESLRDDMAIVVVTAGTSDMPVAEEAVQTLRAMRYQATRVYDVGVAGIHRLFDRLTLLRNAACIIVAAGMEGALASVIGGLVAAPVIAVPTSIGYGASFNGLAALLGMLNSCSAGVTVVNIDNGFGAACAAARLMSVRENRQSVENKG